MMLKTGFIREKLRYVARLSIFVLHLSQVALRSVLIGACFAQAAQIEVLSISQIRIISSDAPLRGI